jgi:pimeloyl-ACP methyl ester carboxylesterase
MQDMPIIIWGEGELVVLIHGSGDTDPAFVWQHQRPLADRYQLLLVTRPGYGARPLVQRSSVEQDVREVCDLLASLAGHDIQSGAHLVGYSYGGCIAMMAAARCPERVRSLTVIEPPAFANARGNPAVEERITRLRLAYDEVETLTPEEFLRRFMAALGQELPDSLALPPEDRKGIEAMQAEPAPWELEIPLAALAETTFPRLIVSGDWSLAFEAVADVLTERLHAERAILSGADHYILDLGEPFNQRLDAFLRTVKEQ